MRPMKASALAPLQLRHRIAGQPPLVAFASLSVLDDPARQCLARAQQIVRRKPAGPQEPVPGPFEGSRQNPGFIAVERTHVKLHLRQFSDSSPHQRTQEGRGPCGLACCRGTTSGTGEPLGSNSKQTKKHHPPSQADPGSRNHTPVGRRAGRARCRGRRHTDIAHRASVTRMAAAMKSSSGHPGTSFFAFSTTANDQIVRKCQRTSSAAGSARRGIVIGLLRKARPASRSA